MAYNPFDDVIDQDPAYMQTGGQSVIPQRRADYTQETFKPIATAISKGYKLLTPEQDTLDEIEKNKQLRELSTAQALRGTKFEEFAGQADLPSAVIQSPGIKERLDAAGYKPQGFIEGMSRTGQFMYGDQRQAYEKLASGQQLTSQDRTAIILSPLDSLDFLFPPLAIRKLGSIGLKTVDDVLKSTSELEEVKQIKNYFGGQGFTPAGVVREANMGSGSGGRLENIYNTKEKLEKALTTANQSGKKYKQKIDFYNEIGISKDEGKRLVMRFPEIKKATDDLINKKEISNTQIVKEFFGKQDPSKKFSIQQIADETGLSYAQVNKVKEYNRKDISDKFVAVKPGIARREEMREFLDTLPEGTFITSQDLRDMFKSTKMADGTITNDVGVFLQSNPSYRKKIKLDNTFDFGFDRGFETVPDFLKNYMDTFMNDGRFHFKNEITNVDFNGNRIDGGQLSRFFTTNKDYKKYFAPTEFKGVGKKEVIPTVLSENRKKLGYQIGSGPRRAEYVFLYDYLRSVNPNLFPNFKGNKKELYQALVDDLVQKDYKELYKNDIATIRNLDKLREQGTERIKNLFDMYSTEFPQQFKNLDKGDFVLHLSHNFPLQLMKDDFGFAGSIKGSTRLSTARTNLEHHRKIEDEIAEIVSEVNRKYVNKEVGPQLRQKIPPEINKRLIELDKKANKLGTVVYFKFGQQQFKVGNEIPPSVDDLVNATEKYFRYVAKQSPGYRPTKTDKNFGDVEIPVNTSKTKDFTGPKFDVDPVTKARGGAVRKAIGGTLENINQQNFTPDPAIEGDSAFQQAVKDENLVAFNPTKIFKFFKDKMPGVYTPSKTDVPPPARDINTNQANLPTVEGLKDYDFALKSFTVDKIQNSNTKAAKPQDWINELQGGNASPSAELQDSGLFQYMADFERYYPNSRMTKEQLINFYEQSPIANLQVKVKAGPTETPYGMADQEFMGRPQHQNAGSAPLDNVGTNYREIVISAGKLPGEDTPFIASSHFNDPNVLVFSRVADYKNAGGDRVSVIQELQTDLLTNVRKEQERLAAEILNQKEKLRINQDRLQRATETNDIYTKNQAQQNIDSIQKTLPQIEKLAETGLIKPYPLTVAKELIPTFEKQMMDFQSEMQDLMRAGINRTDPEYLMKIDDLQKKQFAVFEELRNLNRTSKFDDLTDGVKVPQSSDTENLQLYAQNQSSYESTKDVTTFPPIPFNKQADYVDLILKATIKDAENRNINKIAIMPAEVGANNRWNKTGDAKKKFENLYDKVGVQQLKNIAKKYGGELNVEQIQDTSKGTFGVKFFNKGVDGKDVLDQTDGLDIRDAESYAAYFDARVMQELDNFGSGKVMIRREIAPGQFSEFILKRDIIETSKGYKLVDPTGEEAVIRVLEEYDPSLVDMMVLTLPRAEEATKKAPMFMFRKKEGGIIPEDRLVSITDIYGDY